MKSRHTPEIRFAGFTGDWEQHRFENVFNKQDGIRRGPFGSALKKEFFVKDSEYAVYEQQNAIYDHYETRYNITKEKFEELKNFQLSEGDFILSGAGTIGRISRVPKGIKKGVFNQALIRFKIDENITDSEYFIQWIRSENMQRKLTGANPGSAITNLVPMSEVKKWDVMVPSKNEQTQIGTFFKQLDDIITLQQQELTTLKQTKQGFLQKMFPKEGEPVPEVRFPGFTDAWEQRKLREMLAGPVTDGPHETPKLEESGIPFISVDAIVDNQIDFDRKRGYISEETNELYSKKYRPQYHDVFLVKSGSTVGKTAIVETKERFNIWSPLAAMRVGEVSDPYFLYFLLQTRKMQNQVKDKASNGTQPNLGMRELEKFHTQITPNLEEQKEIGAFFRQIDNLITLHQRELDALKKTKKAFLQKMFV
ncbi:restriction endonuclease subunit S [Bacillus sp. 8YEL33]|uniref:restriction endonuclease subunit S n=1 Tax=Bacillus sp. 8YEL33 TaxID=2778094 RepID=UPI001C9B49C1|nr:restriction endonuclease subunit S [Bacillus sp. 8YEL33]MBY7130269.1 restriction endonuclease subunit S [Bacillus sp. 8YEL33]